MIEVIREDVTTYAGKYKHQDIKELGYKGRSLGSNRGMAVITENKKWFPYVFSNGCQPVYGLEVETSLWRPKESFIERNINLLHASPDCNHMEYRTVPFSGAEGTINMCNLFHASKDDEYGAGTHLHISGISKDDHTFNKSILKALKVMQDDNPFNDFVTERRTNYPQYVEKIEKYDWDNTCRTWFSMRRLNDYGTYENRYMHSETRGDRLFNWIHLNTIFMLYIDKYRDDLDENNLFQPEVWVDDILSKNTELKNFVLDLMSKTKIDKF